MKNNYFHDPKTINVIDKRRIIYVILGLFLFVFTEVGRFIYRPYIYSNEINDFGIADTIGNFGGVMVQIFLVMAFSNPPLKKGFRLVFFFTVGYIVYEFSQPYFPKGVFDWKDVYATILGGLMASLLLIFLHRSIKNNKIYYKL